MLSTSSYEAIFESQSAVLVVWDNLAPRAVFDETAKGQDSGTNGRRRLREQNHWLSDVAILQIQKHGRGVKKMPFRNGVQLMLSP